jgi:hypothetical protein
LVSVVDAEEATELVEDVKDQRLKGTGGLKASTNI